VRAEPKPKPTPKDQIKAQEKAQPQLLEAQSGIALKRRDKSQHRPTNHKLSDYIILDNGALVGCSVLGGQLPITYLSSVAKQLTISLKHFSIKKIQKSFR